MNRSASTLPSQRRSWLVGGLWYGRIRDGCHDLQPPPQTAVAAYVSLKRVNEVMKLITPLLCYWQQRHRRAGGRSTESKKKLVEWRAKRKTRVDYRRWVPLSARPGWHTKRDQTKKILKTVRQQRRTVGFERAFAVLLFGLNFGSTALRARYNQEGVSLTRTST